MPLIANNIIIKSKQIEHIKDEKPKIFEPAKPISTSPVTKKLDEPTKVLIKEKEVDRSQYMADMLSLKL
jgi:hypothetical protein